MPYYLVQASYTHEAIKGMIARPSDRQAAVAAMVESLGGKLHHFFFAFGEYDVVALIETADDGMMAAGALAIASTGTVSRSATTKLLTSDEAMEAMAGASKALGTYQAPMS